MEPAAIRRIGAGVYNATEFDRLIFADASLGHVVIVLPVNPAECMKIQIKKIAGPWFVTIDGNGKSIDGAGAYVIKTQFAAVKLVFQATFKWGII